MRGGLLRIASILTLSTSLACALTVRTDGPELAVAPSRSQSVRDVLIAIDVTSDERILANLSEAQKRVWRERITDAARESLAFRRVYTSADRGAEQLPEVWRAEISLRRVRRDPGPPLDTLALLTAFVIPSYTETQLTVTVLLSPPSGRKLPAVVARSGMREYVSWLILPIGIFTRSSNTVELEMIRELTLDALRRSDSESSAE